MLKNNRLFQVFENTVGGPIISCLESDAEALPALIHYLADNPSEIPSIIAQVPADALQEIENVGQEIISIPEELLSAITSFPSEAENIVTQIIAGHVPTQLENLGEDIASDAEAFASKAKSFFGGLFGGGGDTSTTAPLPLPACLTQVPTASSTVMVTQTAAPSSSSAQIAAVTSAASPTTQDLGSQQSVASNQTSQHAFGAGMLPLHAQGHWLGGVIVVMGLVVFL